MTDESIQRASQMSSTFAHKLESLYQSCVLDDRAPYRRQGRKHDYSTEVAEMIETLQDKALFGVVPNRVGHPGFAGFKHQGFIRNPSLLKGSLIVYANRLEWQKERLLIAQPAGWAEDLQPVTCQVVESDSSSGEEED